MPKSIFRPISAVFLIAFLLFSTGCRAISYHTNPRHYFIIGEREQKQQLTLLFEQLDLPNQSTEMTFHFLREIISLLREAGERDKLNLLLSTQVEQNPENPYNGYYLYIVGMNYAEQNAEPLAIHYFERILRNSPDLLLEGRESLHYLCLHNLIRMESDNELLAEYYAEMIERFPDRIDQGVYYFNQAEIYDQIGEWDKAIEAYKHYLKYPETVIHDEPDAYKRVRTMMAIVDYPGRINWTSETRDDLENQLYWIIRNKDVRAFNNLMAKEGFFALSWAEEEGQEEDLQFIRKIGDVFLASKRTKRLRGFDRDSNDQEAFLKTTGWDIRRDTWYLYLRRIYYPLDPEIHGNWEWAGIYFGEKPYTTED